MVNSKTEIDKCKFQDSEPPGDHADDSANFLHLDHWKILIFPCFWMVIDLICKYFYN